MTATTKKSVSRKQKLLWVILAILAILLVVRMMLPHIVTRYVNKVLADIPGYSGSISDVDIALIRGAYVIEDLKLFKINGNKRVPFIDIPETDLSIEWSALFDGAIVGEVIFIQPQLNFIGGDEKDTQGETDNQTGQNVDWTEPIKRLMPLQINRMEVVDGNINFYDFTTNPQVDLKLQQVNGTATNLNNARRQQEALPSKVITTATSIGQGILILDMDINLLKPIPDLDMDVKFEGIDMPALNDFFMAYAKVDVERGTFNIYSELTVKDGVINGYVKPVAQNVQLLDLEKENQSALKLAWEAIVGLVMEIFENQREDQFATQVPLEGNLNNVETSILPGIWNIFRNAFVKAFERDTDDSIEFDSSNNQNKKDQDENKKDQSSKNQDKQN